MKARYITLLLLISHFALKAQITNQVDSACFNKSIIDFSMDGSGNIFLAFKGGTISKYSPDLDSLYSYSPSKVGDVRLLEAGNGLRVFAFYDFFQEYLSTDRFLSQPTQTKLSNPNFDFIEIATQGQDNNIWMVENSSFQLIKFNVTTEKIELETALSSIIEEPNSSFSFIKEYQNQLFLIDKNSGIYIFDNLGNFLRKVPAKTSKCCFYGNKLLYIENHELVVSGLYDTSETRTKLANKKIIGVLLSKNGLYYLSSKCLSRSL